MSAVLTIAYAREQEAGVPKGGELGRVKNILAASTRQDWEADGPRLWVWVCPVSTDSLPLGHSTSSQANLFVL
jgi:hypothetical protein